jgi:6-phosphogluconolactonase (cycloisomerase 2 family)
MRAGRMLAALLLMALPAQAQMERAYIGTFTPAPGRPAAPGARGEGIYLTELDAGSGRLTPPRLAARTPSPSWLVVDHRRAVLYAANESGSDGGISAFRIARDTGALTPIGRVALPAPTHLALSPDGHWLVAASYGGTVSLVKLAADGAPGAVAQSLRLDGTARPSQMTGPPGNLWLADHGGTHMHGVAFHPDGRHLVLDDYGLDVLTVFALQDGQLRQVSRQPQLAGSAPRHSVWNAKGSLLYTVSEQDSMVAVHAFDPATGALDQRQRLSVLPPHYSGTAAAGEILLSRDGRDLYVSNRFHDSIAHLRVGADGLLHYGGDTVTGTSMPRLLSADPSGRWLLAGGQNSDTIASFRIGANGAPQPTGLYTAAPTPVALAFDWPARR